MDITKELPKKIEHKGKVYKLDMSFDNILNVFEMFKGDFLLENEKILLAVNMIVTNKNIQYDHELIKKIFDLFSFEKNRAQNTSTKCVDFIQDSAYIYSSFMMDYNINLFECEGKMHWWEFTALFKGLSKKTKIREIMEIRQRPIPERNKHNSNEISNLLELKNYYKLEVSQSEKEKNFQKSLANLAGILKEKVR